MSDILKRLLVRRAWEYPESSHVAEMVKDWCCGCWIQNVVGAKHSGIADALRRSLCLELLEYKHQHQPAHADFPTIFPCLVGDNNLNTPDYPCRLQSCRGDTIPEYAL